MGCPKIEQRIILQLPKTDGGFSVHPVITDYEKDKQAFLYALGLYRWIKEYEKLYGK